MEHDELQFDDPGLKSAIQRVWGDDAAPQRLRGRVGHLIATAGSMDEAAAGAGRGSAWQRWQGRVYACAAAAVLILGIGLLVLYYQGAFDTSGPAFPGGNARAVSLPSKTQVPLTLARSMVATHQACGRLHDHRFVDLPANNYAALSMKLTADLGFPVLARGLGPEWRFKGAGECNVGQLRGSHLMFALGDQRVSVFSLPSSCMNGVAPGATFEGTVDNHPVAGFARGGAVYAVVGSSPAGSSHSTALNAEAVAALRDGFFGHFDPIHCGDGDTDDLDFDY